VAEQLSRSAAVLAVSMGLTFLAGCGEPRGTGKHGELYIQAPATAVAGVVTTVSINDLRTWPENSDPVDSERVERWDFKGTTLDVQAPEGFDFEISYKEAPASYMVGGYKLQTRCNAEPGIAHEIRLRVMAGDEVRYEDAFALTCQAPNG
jgi:hypothetical protein